LSDSERSKVHLDFKTSERLLRHLSGLVVEGWEHYPAENYEELEDDIATLAMAILEQDPDPDNW